MAHYLDLNAWSRKAHFEFFLDYDSPFSGVCAPVDVTRLYGLTSQVEGPSFFLASLHIALTAANAEESFRYRIRGRDVLVHDVVHGGSTVLRDDGTFGFAYFDYEPDYPTFARRAAAILERARAETGALRDRADRDDLIHMSVLPWISFTGLSHARRWGTEDSIPKVVFGKHHPDGGRRMMPVSVEVHHALMDGLHLGRFFERLQAGLDRAETLLVAEGRRSAGPG